MSYQPKPSRTLARRIAEYMADGKPYAAAEIAAALGAKAASVSDHLRRGAEETTVQRYRAVDRLGHRKSVRYVLGRGENIAGKLSNEAREQLSDDEVDALYRAKAPWWPVADVVVISAIDAMVRQGAAV